jgi:hypothetical protein
MSSTTWSARLACHLDSIRCGSIRWCGGNVLMRFCLGCRSCRCWLWITRLPSNMLEWCSR